MNLLTNYDYPGNIRELEHLIERAVVLSHKDTINADHLPDLDVSTFRNFDGRLLSLEEFTARDEDFRL